MTGSCCSATDSEEKPVRRRASRWLDAVGWLAPATALALMPKCPMCVAAYVAVFTGIGLSLPVATLARTTLIVVCVASLAFMAVRMMVRAAGRSPQ